MGVTFKKLKDGAWMMLPVMDMRSMTGGIVLEGVGVKPDIRVKDLIPYSQGRDWIREKGLDRFEEINHFHRDNRCSKRARDEYVDDLSERFFDKADSLLE